MSPKAPSHRARLEAPLVRPRATVRRRSTRRWLRERDLASGAPAPREAEVAALPLA